MTRWKAKQKPTKDEEMRCSSCDQCYAGEVLPFTYCIYCKQAPADHHGRCCHMKPHRDLKSSENHVKEAGHGEETEWVNKLEEWWHRTHGLGNPNVERLVQAPVGAQTPNSGQEIHWTTRGSVHYLENVNPSDWTMERMLSLVRNWCFVKQSPRMKLEAIRGQWKDKTRWTIKIKPQGDMSKDICNFYVSQYKDGTPKWIMTNCSEYKKWIKEMEELRAFICRQVIDETVDAPALTGNYDSNKKMGGSVATVDTGTPGRGDGASWRFVIPSSTPGVPRLSVSFMDPIQAVIEAPLMQQSVEELMDDTWSTETNEDPGVNPVTGHEVMR